VNPGQAVFFYNPGPTVTSTFVGTVPQMGQAVAGIANGAAGTATGLTNSLNVGYSLVGSIVPVSGDLAVSNATVINGITYSNNITTNFFGSFNGAPSAPNAGDWIYTYDPVAGYNQVVFEPLAAGGWVNGPGTAGPGGGDPALSNSYQGFFYYNSSSAPETWVETFVINP
jgi:hypothetical protein